jgi:hypothetical protein
MSILILVVISVLAIAFCLPFADQVSLANSLIVSRDDDKAWICKVCDDTNKPLHSHFVENTELNVKSIISVYPNFVVLAFRYTATALNIWQDLLYVYQVAD